MATDKHIRLVEQLVDKTKKGMLSWEPTAREDEFLSTLGGNVVFIIRPGNTGETLIVKDDQARVLLTVTSDELGEISQLYTEARRQALDVDGSLDDVLERLTKLDKR